ncbi:hypothetical protein [Oceanobacillus oncorhynchi]|uniref:hypothetical protein n=1 Tax=Oceanobacillus oncorhynchi TaxID=545501 RepID=UPI0005959094|nr:hypothetical protein [Oceanobacillus oncorhynchi]
METRRKKQLVKHVGYWEKLSICMICAYPGFSILAAISFNLSWPNFIKFSLLLCAIISLIVFLYIFYNVREEKQKELLSMRINKILEEDRWDS